MRKVDIKKENKRKDLLNAAFELFTSQDFQNTTIADIVGKAGIAKGTFYLYFKDKNDIRNQLISTKSTQLFKDACSKLASTDLHELDEQFIFLTDELLRALEKDKALLVFLSKHLSWGIFKNSMMHVQPADGITAKKLYDELIERSSYRFENPEIIVYLIIELVAGVSYNAILFGDPAGIEDLKPYLHSLIRRILTDFNIAEA